MTCNVGLSGVFPRSPPLPIPALVITSTLSCTPSPSANTFYRNPIPRRMMRRVGRQLAVHAAADMPAAKDRLQRDELPAIVSGRLRVEGQLVGAGDGVLVAAADAHAGFAGSGAGQAVEEALRGLVGVA